MPEFGGLDAGSVAATLGVRVDDSGFREFDRKIAEADRKKAKAQLSFDVDDRRLEAFESKLTTVTKKQAIRVGLDERDLRAVDAELNRRIRAMERKKAKFVIDADTEGIKRAERDLERLRREIVAVRKQRLSLDERSVNAFGLALNRVQASLSGSGGGVARFNRLALTLRNTIRTVAFSTLIAGAGFAVQALGALSAAVAGLSGSLASLSGVLVAIPAGIAAAVQGIGTGLLGFSGVGDAVKASMKASSVATKDATAAGDRQRESSRALADAQRAAQDAQRGLTAARQEAREELQRLRFAEEGASLSVAEAEARLQELRRDQTSTPLEIARAELELKEARTQSRKATDERAQAERRGVSGSTQVVQAQRQVADAARSVADAQREATRSAAQGSAATDKLAQQMAKLSPAGQSFVRFLVSLKPRLDELRATAQRGLLPGVEQGIRSAMRNFGALQDVVDVTARTLGRNAERFGSFLGRDDVGKDLELIGTRNARLMDRAARSTQNFLSALRHVLVAAGPFLDWLSKVGLGFSRLVDSSSKAGRESGRMARFFDRTRETMERLGSILQSVSAGLVALGSSAKRYLGDFLLAELDKVAQKFEDFAESAEGRNRMRDFFVAMRRPLTETAGLIGDIVGAMLRLSAQPGFAGMVRQLRDLVPVVEKVTAEMSKAFGPAVISTLSSLVRLFGTLAGSAGPLTIFVRTIGSLADGFRFLVEKLPGLKQGLYGAAAGFALFKSANLVASVTGLKSFGHALLRLKGFEAGTTFGDVLIPKLRALGPRIKGVLGRLFGTAATSASTVAASKAGEQLAMDLPDAMRRREGRLAGFFRRWGLRLGRVAGAGMAIGLVVAFRDPILKALDKVGDDINNFFSRIKVKTKKVGPISVPVGLEFQSQAEQDKDAKRAADKFLKDRGFKGAAAPRTRLRPDSERNPIGERQPRRTQRREERAPQPRRQTVTVDPVVGVAGLPTARGIRRQMDKASTVVRAEFDQLGRLLERRARRLDDPFRNLRLLRGRDPLGLEGAIRRSGEDSEGIARRAARRIGQAFEAISRFARVEGRETGQAFASGLDDSARQAERRVQRMRERLVSDFRAVTRIGSSESRELVGNMRDTFGRLDDVVSGPTSRMLRIVASALRSLGASGVARLSASAERIAGRAFGGMLPGYSRTDDRLIAVRGGEGVLRPEDHVPFVSNLLSATKEMGLQPFGSLPEMFQRTGAAFASGGTVQKVARKARGYATGGMVDPAWDPGSEVLNKAISARVGRWAKRYGANMTAGYDPGGGHVSPGHNVTGTATDMVPLGGWAARATARFEQGLRSLVSQGLKVLYGTGGIGTPWPNHGRGNHAHIEWGGSSRGGARGAAAEGKAAPKVRASVRGPAGAIRSMVRGGLKRVERAANRRMGDSEVSFAGVRGAGGGETANKRLGRRMMERIFPANQWPALRALWEGESAWDEDAVNPSSGAGGIPQALPASKMGPNWRNNPRVQIGWGLRYIKQRYGSPSRALAAWRSRSPHWYARGGMVPGFAAGGTVGKIVRDIIPAGAKKPSRRKAERTKGGKVRLRPFRAGRVGRYVEPPLLSGFRAAYDDISDGGALQEEYSEREEDANVTQEEFLVDSIPGGVDWAAVRIRIGELDGLMAQAALIEQKTVAAQGLAIRIVDQLRALAKRQLERVSEIYKRVSDNIGRLLRLKTHLKNERKKKGRNRDQGTINYIENLISAIVSQNQELAGTRDEMPRDWMNAPSSSALGKIAVIVRDVDAELDPNGSGVGGSLIEIQGRNPGTRRGGKLDDIRDTIESLLRERNDLQPGGKLVTPASASAATSSTADAQSFLTGLGDLRRDFGSNFRPLLSFAGGGRVPGTLGQPVQATVHGGELIVDPRTGAITVTVKQERSEPAGDKKIVLNEFNGPVTQVQPEDRHADMRKAELELRTRF